MEHRKLKNGLTIRGDAMYCPLSFQLDTYWGCETNCAHCYLRRLNRTWGEDLRPLDIGLFRDQLKRGLANPNPRSPLAHAMKSKKTIRLGNKADPYQDAEKKYRVTRAVIRTLLHYNWSFVIQTKFTRLAYRDRDLFALKPHLVTLMPIITPGLVSDWELFERKRTTAPFERMRACADFVAAGMSAGVNGEPFIPSYHTEKQFREMLRQLKSFGIKSYNTYHLHLNDWVLKELHAVGLDIEKIAHHNKDEQWQPILRRLIAIAEEEDMTLGCPDFVNSGRYQETANTCCGINVPNPCTFTFVEFKRRWLAGEDPQSIIDATWDGIADKEAGAQLMFARKDDTYTLKDVEDVINGPGNILRDRF